jgi:hypothetical protein
MAMHIKLIEGLHLTAADKRDIAHIIGQGWQHGQTRQKRYTVRHDGGGRYSVTIKKSYRSDMGERRATTYRATIEAGEE